MSLDDPAWQLLNFNQKMDINLLDLVVNSFYTGQGSQQRMAQDILNYMKEHPDAWTRVDTILEFSQNLNTKYFGLQILEKVIKTRWKILPRDQCEGIKKYIVGLIIKTAVDSSNLEKNKLYLGKLNLILVQILKHEWPKRWPSFITDIVGASKSSEALCQNSVQILKLLSEEVFDFSLGQMTQAKAKYLKESLHEEIPKIVELFISVLENSGNASLVHETLEALLRFLNWIPQKYMFEKDLINILVYKMLPFPLFRNVSIRCLTEIASVKNDMYKDKFLILFTTSMLQLRQMLPCTTNIPAAYQQGSEEDQRFIQNLSLFLCTLLKNHSKILEVCLEYREILYDNLDYLVLLSKVEEKEIFKICLEYWNHLAMELYNESPDSVTVCPKRGVSYRNLPPRRQVYFTFLTEIRQILISHMVKPEEVIVVANEQGEVVREFMKDTDAATLYQTMKETLVYMTHLEYTDTERLMTEKLHKQVNGTEWSWKNLNTLCWAIGSISEALPEEIESRFMETIIQNLLILNKQKETKDDRAIVASNIMYIVGQYPRFFAARRQFLSSMINKLFEFMHDSHDGVQDMACDTFLKISKKCQRFFVEITAGDTRQLLNEILEDIPSITSDLQPYQVHTFYEAVGYLIRAETNQVEQTKHIEMLMGMMNHAWDIIILQITENLDTLRDANTIKQLIFIMKTNTRVGRAIGQPFVFQLEKIYMEILHIYKCTSDNVSAAILTHGEAVLKQLLIKDMQLMKKDALRLITELVGQSEDLHLINNTLIVPLLDAVLMDYQTSLPAAREPEVLNTMTQIVKKIGNLIKEHLPRIFKTVFETTLDMINKDFQEFPDHRANFFDLLQAMNTHSFPALLSLPPTEFRLVLDSIIWAFKHPARNITHTGLSILNTLLQNVSQDDSVSQSFYEAFFLDILQHMLSVVTDTSHASVLTLQATVLAHMFSLVDDGRIPVLLNPDHTDINQHLLVENFIIEILKNAFPHLKKNFLEKIHLIYLLRREKLL
ncbi:exportin-1-like isoform X2 [Protopterus annectens]|uniref:exportin-1-like isoform X2 n=1 Tax=Protopterus annectens TaxID=7888 RepID=UPI001CFBC440|nr:exportin-1-like isoform X2 [Protopterus annectens]